MLPIDYQNPILALSGLRREVMGAGIHRSGVAGSEDNKESHEYEQRWRYKVYGQNPEKGKAWYQKNYP